MHLLISLESWQGYRTLKSHERERRQGGLSLNHGSAVYEQGTSARFVVVVFLNSRQALVYTLANWRAFLAF